MSSACPHDCTCLNSASKISKSNGHMICHPIQRYLSIWSAGVYLGVPIWPSALSHATKGNARACTWSRAARQHPSARLVTCCKATPESALSPAAATARAFVGAPGRRMFRQSAAAILGAAGRASLLVSNPHLLCPSPAHWPFVALFPLYFSLQVASGGPPTTWARH